MKKISWIFLSMLLLFLTSCSVIDEWDTQEIINDINEHSNFELPLLMEITEETDLSEFICVPGFGMYGYYNQKYGEIINPYGGLDNVVYYETTSWPDYSSGGWYITVIYVTDPNINFYHLHVGDNFVKWEELLLEKGFAVDENYQNSYRNNKVRISIMRDEFSNTIKSFSIVIEVTNNEGIVF